MLVFYSTKIKLDLKINFLYNYIIMDNNNFIRTFDDFDISASEEQYIYSLLNEHDPANILNYHGYLSPKLTFKTKFAQALKSLGTRLNLRLAGIYAFTAYANTKTSIHVDGDREQGPLPWRLCWYCRGGAASLEWYSKDINNEFDSHVGAYVCDGQTNPIFVQKLNMRSAFVRTDYPHRLDLNNTTADRLTITATFKPYISWEELQTRLDNVENIR
jgi:hypothetical protein